MNGLLGWALGALGFKVTRATGAVMRALAGDPKNGNHLVLRVDLAEGTFLADVGFGDGPHDPFAVVPGRFTSHGFGYELTALDAAWWRLQDLRPGAKSFDFTLGTADEALLSGKCALLQSAPISPFVQNLIAQRHTREGHAILRGRTISHVTPHGAQERLIGDAGDLAATLRTVFDLDVPEVAALWPKVAARHEEVMAQKREA